VNTVYVLGAGFNRAAYHAYREGLQPPLDADFFRILLTQSDFERHLKNDARALRLMRYIDRYWRIDSISDPASTPGLEAVYSLIDLQRRECAALGQVETANELDSLFTVLTNLLAHMLAAFEGRLTPQSNSELQSFARLALSERAEIITFNYDTLLEWAMEEASGWSEPVPSNLTSDPLCDQSLAFSTKVWNRNLAYGFEFDTVEVRGNAVPGSVYYHVAGNEVYTNRILKLHGSLGWYYGPDGLLLGDAKVLPSPMLPSLPALLTPVVLKPFYEEPFRHIWLQARDVLTRANTLILVGYSFPPTDFHVQKLFREAFVDRQPDVTVVVNPDERAATIVNTLVAPASVETHESLRSLLTERGVRFRQVVLENGDTDIAADGVPAVHPDDFYRSPLST